VLRWTLGTCYVDLSGVIGPALLSADLRADLTVLAGPWTFPGLCWRE
jgi:hypothetical protein